MLNVVEVNECLTRAERTALSQGICQHSGESHHTAHCVEMSVCCTCCQLTLVCWPVITSLRQRYQFPPFCLILCKKGRLVLYWRHMVTWLLIANISATP